MTDADHVETPTLSLLTIRIPQELDIAIQAAGKRNQLTKSAVARLAIERGLTVLESQLASAYETTEP